MTFTFTFGTVREYISDIRVSLVAQMVESACNVRDLGSILGLGKSPGEGKGYSLQCSGLKNPMDCSPTGSTVYEILQARILEWVAMPSSRGSSLLQGI